METTVHTMRFVLIYSVLTVPMRNGNIYMGKRNYNSLFVLTVPMRNGNLSDVADTNKYHGVLTVPMRNGNMGWQAYRSGTITWFLPYL